eukprot:NODE_612_length_6011_cov_0.245095.p1 type:complete len:310 gc:universal NODE_612_length_6011_cov_0.245095:5770-4841(-)
MSDTFPFKSVLITGGSGFVGRHLVEHLQQSGVSDIKVVDKSLPTLSWLNDKHRAALDKVQFVQANLCLDAGVAKVFDKQYDLVINLASETKYGQSDEVYQEKVHDVALRVGKAAVGKCKVFLECSTSQVYDPKDKPVKENAKTKPWTKLAEFKLQVEQELSKLDLNLVILRPVIIYGTADISGITPRLIIGRVYQHLQEPMEMLWSGDLAINTVHVDDVCSAILFTSKYHLTHPAKGEIYNVVDHSESTQESINTILQSLFGIKTSFAGTMVSQFAKLNLASVVQDVNEKHLQPWSELLKKEDLNSKTY